MIIRNGERILGRGCDDELTLDLFSIIDDDLGEYEIYIEAYLNSTYAPCSNTIKFRLVYDSSEYDADSDIPQFAKHMGSDNEIPLEITRDQAGNVVCEDSSLADHYDTDKLMNLIQDREVLEKIAEEASGLKLRSQAVRKLGGYICTSCGKLNPPEEQLSCSCRFCGAESHDYVHVNNVVEYRDYEVGDTYDECTRCHKKINYRSINTM